MGETSFTSSTTRWASRTRFTLPRGVLLFENKKEHAIGRARKGDSMDREKMRVLAFRFTFTWFPTVIKVLIVACAVCLAAIVFAEVWLRYIFQLPLLWVEEIAVIPAFWMYLLGAAYGAYTRTHIKVELMDLLVKDSKRRKILAIMTSIITVVIATMFVTWGFGAFTWDLSMDQRSYTLLLPMIWARSSIFFGGMIIDFYFIVELIDLIGQYRGHPPLLVLREEDQA